MLRVESLAWCADCLWHLAQQQLNRQALADGAPVVPAPATALWGSVALFQALVGCEGCRPLPTEFASWLPEARTWLCPGCVSDLVKKVSRRGRSVD